MADKKLEQSPLADWAMECAEAGARRTASAHIPHSTWLFHIEPGAESTNSTATGYSESVDKTKGETKSAPERVSATRTSAPFFLSNRTKCGVL
jgi:hypothetical protein